MPVKYITNSSKAEKLRYFQKDNLLSLIINYFFSLLSTVIRPQSLFFFQCEIYKKPRFFMISSFYNTFIFIDFWFSKNQS